MKTNEEFRASVYARAEREKKRIAVRRQKARRASLSVAMLLVVALVAVPLARIWPPSDGTTTVPPITEVQTHTLNPAALSTRMVLLVGEQAVVLDNEAKQKEFVDQYKAAMGDGEDAKFPAVDIAREIHSTDELMEFLADKPEAARAMRVEYNEAFFERNNLNVMPMGLASQPDGAHQPEETTRAAAEMTTIPDMILPSDANAPTVPYDEITHDEMTTTDFDSELLNSSDVTLLLLVPVNKKEAQ